MTVLPDWLLPHRVDIEPVDPYGGGQRWQTKLSDVHAQVTGSSKLVVDQRPGMVDAESGSQEIEASQMVILQATDWTAPGARVTIWKGTPREDVLQAVNVEYYEHPIAPSSAVLWLA